MEAFPVSTNEEAERDDVGLFCPHCCCCCSKWSFCVINNKLHFPPFLKSDFVLSQHTLCFHHPDNVKLLTCQHGFVVVSNRSRMFQEGLCFFVRVCVSVFECVSLCALGTLLIGIRAPSDHSTDGSPLLNVPSVTHTRTHARTKGSHMKYTPTCRRM